MKAKLLLASLVMLTMAAFGQRQITGEVNDEKGEPLPGVNILVKGTSQGTVSDVNGQYAINAPDDAILTFSFIGYVTQEIPVGTQTSITVQLIQDVKALEEVVVVGYGTSTVKEVTGSISTVRANQITAINPVRIDQALQGQMSGVQISSASGSPGGALNIRIRGLTTNGNNDPLIIVDGIPYSPDGLNALNPSDIESVNVLKDATAGIYGVLSSNGVIMITTKQGRKNAKPSFDFNGYYGIQETAKKLSLLNAKEYAVLKNEAYAAGGQNPLFANTELGEGTDWQDEVFESAPIQNYNLSINGGSEKSTYSVGGSFLDQNGIVGGDKSGFRRYNARLNFTTELAPRVTLQNILLFTNERRSTLPENTISSVLFNAINASPVASVRNTEGNYTYLEEVNDVINPVAQIANSFNEARVNKFVGKQELTYKINDRFELSGRIGYNYANVTTKTFNPLVYYGSGKPQNSTQSPDLVPDSLLLYSKVVDGQTVSYKIPRLNSVEEKNDIYFNYNAEAFLNYNQTFNNVHKIKGTIGISYFGDQSETVTGTAHNIPYNSWEFADISLADGANLQNNVTSSQYRSRLQSYFLRGEYGYEGKYLVSAIVRRDASSRFGANNRFGIFPSLSAAWVASEESFFASDFVNFLKIRGSYGASGNDRIGDFRYLALLGGEGTYPFNDQLVNGVAIGTLGNEDLKWESTQQMNFGADLNILSDKVSITADYYIKSTKDLLFRPDVSGVLGAYGAGGTPPYVNAGSVRNSGFEFMIAYNDQLTEKIGINVSYNLTTIKNEVTALPAGVDFYEFGSFGVGGMRPTRMQVGYPIGYFYGYETEGIYQSNEEVAERGVTQANAGAGDLRFVDQDGNGEIRFGDNTDKTIIGSPIPDVIMGFNLGVNFFGFDFSAMVYASLGNEILRNYERDQPLANQLAYRLNRWTGEGSTNEHPRQFTSTSVLKRNNIISDYYIEDGSFARLRNVQLGYTLPSGVTEKIGASRFRVYVAANNLLTLTKYRGFDPDFSTDDPTLSGIDYGFYPQARTYMVGFNFNF